VASAVLAPATLADSVHVRAQSSESEERRARSIVYHPREVVSLRAKLRYTTLIVFPDGQDVMEVTSGDKEFWIVNARGRWVSVKPAKAGLETNLHVLTTSGVVYAFVLAEVSAFKGQEPDLTVYIDADAPSTPVSAGWPQYVPVQQLDDLREQLDVAKAEGRRAAASAQAELERYPSSLQFPYEFKANVRPFLVRAMFHDERFTYIQSAAKELPALYEVKDGAPNLVNFEVRLGTYVVPKVLDEGYLMVGKERLAFRRAGR
jgi:type IV secretion system protein VirB9